VNEVDFFNPFVVLVYL